jgi:hypothetical protein
MICRRRSGPFRNDFGFLVRALARRNDFVIFFSVGKRRGIRPET